jgi:hypothetical protein
MFYLLEFFGSKNNLMILEHDFIVNPVEELFVGKGQLQILTQT